MRVFEQDDSDENNKMLGVERRKANFEKNLVLGFVVISIPLWFFVLRHET